MTGSSDNMSSSQPYMLRAIHAWIVDNDCTPYLLVNAGYPGVQVPAQAVKDGQVVLNLAPQAISAMDMGNDTIAFLTRFSGASMRVSVPIPAVKALYAQETGQGLAFPETEGDNGMPAAATENTDGAASGSADDGGSKTPPDGDKPAGGGPHLRVIK